MSHAFFDTFRGFSSKNNPIRFFLGNDNLVDINLGIAGPRWSAKRNKETGQIKREGWNSPRLAFSTVFGAGLLCAGLFTNSYTISSEFLHILTWGGAIDSSVTMIALTVAGALLLAPTTLWSFGKCFVEIYYSCLYKQSQYGTACNGWKLVQKCMVIFTDSILSLLCAAGQTLFGGASLLAALVCFMTQPIPGFNKKTGLLGVKQHLRDFGTAYLDIIAHLTSAALSFFINLGDFLGSLHAYFCRETPLKSADISMNTMSY